MKSELVIVEKNATNKQVLDRAYAFARRIGAPSFAVTEGRLPPWVHDDVSFMDQYSAHRRDNPRARIVVVAFGTDEEIDALDEEI